MAFAINGGLSTVRLADHAVGDFFASDYVAHLTDQDMTDGYD